MQEDVAFDTVCELPVVDAVKTNVSRVCGRTRGTSTQSFIRNSLLANLELQ